MYGLLALYRRSFSNLQRNIWILSITMFVNRSGSMVLLFTSLYMTKKLGFSIAEAGTVMSFYGFGSILGSYAGGWLTDRKNYFDIMLGSLIGSACLLLNLLWVKSYTGLGILIFLYAFTSDIFRPANSKAIALFSNDDNRTRSVSLVRLAVNLGFTVGPAAGGFIAISLGYKWLFVMDALTSFAAAIILILYLPRKPVVHSVRATAVLNDSRTSAYRDKRYLFFILMVALYGACFFQIFASIPQFFSRVCGYTEDTIGLLMALNGFLVVLIEMPLVMKLEQAKNGFRYILWGTLMLPVCFLMLQFGMKMMIWSVLYTVAITVSEIFAMPFMMNHALSQPPKERQGQYTALYSISFGIANIAAPVIGLGVADKWGFDTMFNVLIAMSLVTATGFFFCGKGFQKTEMDY